MIQVGQNHYYIYLLLNLKQDAELLCDQCLPPSTHRSLVELCPWRKVYDGLLCLCFDSNLYVDDHVTSCCIFDLSDERNLHLVRYSTLFHTFILQVINYAW